MNHEEFFSDVQNEIDKIIVTVGSQREQPKDGPRRDSRDKTKWSKNSGAVYMTTVYNRAAKDCQVGRVSIMPYWQAAYQMVGPTDQGAFYRVSTDDEIKNFLQEEAEKRQQILSGFTQRKGIAQFTVPPVNEGASK